MGRKQRRLNDKKRKIKKIVRGTILVSIICIIVYFIYGFYRESKIRIEEKSYTDEIEEIANQIQETKEINEINYDIPETYSGYQVNCDLEIPKIEFKSSVLENYTLEGLDVCISKYWGPEPNEIGNFCIVGHNYNKQNMFYNLIDLEIGDIMYLTDKKNRKYEYEIYDVYKVKPQNTKPLSQDTEGKREITLITCVNYSNARLIIKAKQT